MREKVPVWFVDRGCARCAVLNQELDGLLQHHVFLNDRVNEAQAEIWEAQNQEPPDEEATRFARQEQARARAEIEEVEGLMLALESEKEAHLTQDHGYQVVQPEVEEPE